jgi:hypothetical protein
MLRCLPSRRPCDDRCGLGWRKASRSLALLTIQPLRCRALGGGGGAARGPLPSVRVGGAGQHLLDRPHSRWSSMAQLGRYAGRKERPVPSLNRARSYGTVSGPSKAIAICERCFAYVKANSKWAVLDASSFLVCISRCVLPPPSASAGGYSSPLPRLFPP